MCSDERLHPHPFMWSQEEHDKNHIFGLSHSSRWVFTHNYKNEMNESKWTFAVINLSLVIPFSGFASLAKLFMTNRPLYIINCNVTWCLAWNSYGDTTVAKASTKKAASTLKLVYIVYCLRGVLTKWDG